MEVIAVSHVHSKWSYDGSWSLEALRDKFQRRGCRVLLMTEHDKGFSESRLKEYREACAETSNEHIVLVPGIEYSDSGNRTHVLVWGPVPFLGEGLPTGEMLEGACAAKGLAVLAHPTRKDAWKYVEPAWAKKLVGIEIWNRKYDGWAPSRTAPDLLKSYGKLPFVGLDFHTQRQSFPLTMSLELEREVTEQAVVDCLRAGRCYPQAFGRSLEQTVVRQAMPVLGAAEKSRRAAASLLRYSRKIVDRGKPKPNKSAS